jgi:hypothetical protein
VQAFFRINLPASYPSNCMPKKMSFLKSSVLLKCPSCHEESMFVNERVYTWTNMGEVKEKCGTCGANLKPETGFYFGAAYVNWGLTVALWVSVLVALNVFDLLGWIHFSFYTHPVTFLLTGIIATILLFPILLRFSRSLWAHLFIKEKA